MKPGLKKITALILAATTLFGGGALSAFTAYADDTTVDTSAQLQAEPDTKTTMGDDASEMKPDTGSDDKAGTDTQNQPDDASPQADAGQAAPDVTIHDMLDTDTAYVSKLVFCQVGVGRFGVSFSPCERRVSGRFGVGRSCWLLVIALVIA